MFRGISRGSRRLVSIPLLLAVAILATMRAPGSLVADRGPAYDRRGDFGDDPWADAQ